MKQKRDNLPTVMLSYVAGVSEDTSLVSRKFDIKVLFKSGQNLRSMLTNMKTLPVEKQSKVVYHIPCSCGKIHIGETVRRLKTKEGASQYLQEGGVEK